MKLIMISSIICFALSAQAQYRHPRNRHIETISVRGQGYFPDALTATGICLANGGRQAIGFTQWRQAGDKIEGMRSYDGSAFFSTTVWRGGMAIDTVNCLMSYYPRPAGISVRGQGYFPDELTAQGVCVANGYYRTVGFTQWKQAGDKIEGMRSFDGSAFFSTTVWRGGMALDVVNCE